MSTRYQLQEAFKPLGPESTLQLAKSHVVIIGCGGTGSHVADTLARMGVGYLTVCDPDIVEGGNLHRQLYIEADIDGYKAAILAAHVARINSEVQIRPVIERVTADNINELLDTDKRWARPTDLILDCTDNMEARWLINEYAVKNSIPWIYCGVSKSEGIVMPIIPGESACLRCTGWTPQDPKEKLSGGIFPPAVALVASMQATIAIKILTKDFDERMLMLRRFNVWTMELRSFNVQPNPKCPVCGINRSAELSGLRDV